MNQRIIVVAFTAAIICSAQTPAQVRSPQAFAQFIESHRSFDWGAVWNALGADDQGKILPQCGLNDKPCTTQILTASNPEQAILVIQDDSPRSKDVYLRYFKRPNGGWQFAGVHLVYINNDLRQHEMSQIWNKPILKITQDRAQVGFGIGQELEQWFDLTQPGFEPIFSFTANGWSSPWGAVVSREIKMTPLPSQTGIAERIGVTLTLQYTREGLHQETTFNAVYDRRDPKSKFILARAYSGSDRRTPIPTKDFEGLAEPFVDIPNERMLVYAFSGLQTIAAGSDPESRKWLQAILDHTKDTPEKRQLLDLLNKR